MNIYKQYIVVGFLLLSIVISNVNVCAQDNHVWMGIDLFLTIVGEIKDIDSKQNIEKNESYLLLVLIYKDKKNFSEKLANYIAIKIQDIKGRQVKVEVTREPMALFASNKKIAGIFLVQKFLYHTDDNNLFQNIIHFAQAKTIITFSPFYGDLKRGIVASMDISDIILPYINLTALEQSKIKINEFFLDICTIYKTKP